MPVCLKKGNGPRGGGPFICFPADYFRLRTPEEIVPSQIGLPCALYPLSSVFQSGARRPLRSQ